MWGGGVQGVCQSFLGKKQGREIVNNLPSGGGKKGQKWPKYKALISRYKIPTKVY